MTRSVPAVLLLSIAAAGALGGCGGSATPAAPAPPAARSVTATPPAPAVTPVPDCSPPVGGRCPGPRPMGDALIGHLWLRAEGTVVTGEFACGGTLTARETPGRVLLTYAASAVRAGAMACARVPLRVVLAAPLAGRELVDAVTGSPVPAPVAPGA